MNIYFGKGVYLEQIQNNRLRERLIWASSWIALSLWSTNVINKFVGIRLLQGLSFYKIRRNPEHLHDVKIF